MKKEIPIAGIIVAVVLVLGIVGYFLYSAVQSPGVSVPDSKEMRNRMVNQQNATPAPAATPGAPKSAP